MKQPRRKRTGKKKCELLYYGSLHLFNNIGPTKRVHATQVLSVFFATYISFGRCISFFYLKKVQHLNLKE